jgi:hypothetical protein
MRSFEFFAAVESRGDGLHPVLRAGVANLERATEITRRVDEVVRAAPSATNAAASRDKQRLLSLLQSDALLLPASRVGQ